MSASDKVKWTGPNVNIMDGDNLHRRLPARVPQVTRSTTRHLQYLRLPKSRAMMHK